MCVGIVVSGTEMIVQFGNTSTEMARRQSIGAEILEHLRARKPGAIIF